MKYTLVINKHFMQKKKKKKKKKKKIKYFKLFTMKLYRLSVRKHEVKRSHVHTLPTS